MGDRAQAQDPRFPAAIDLLRRVGASSVQIRYSDDEEPVVWMAVAEFGPDSAVRKHRPDAPRWAAAGDLHPLHALFALCDDLIDGGTCRHCSKPTGFVESLEAPLPGLDGWVCWYAWDPELATFRRGCEGD